MKQAVQIVAAYEDAAEGVLAAAGGLDCGMSEVLRVALAGRMA